MIPLVAVSGAECVEALLGAGFTVSARTSDGATSLTRGLHAFVVPDVAMLPPDALQAILRGAGVPYSDFLDLLSETPTEPAIPRPRPAPAAAR